MKKKSNTFKIVALVLAVITVTVGFVATMYDPNILHNALSWLMNSPDGITMAVGTVVTGGTITQQAATGGDSYSETTEYLDSRDVEREVLLYKPYQTPILTLLSDNGIGTTDSWEKKYYATDVRGMYTQINHSGADSYSGGTAVIEVDDSSIFTLYNTVYFPAITGATKVDTTTSKYLMGIITAFPEANHITVKIVNPASGGDLGTADFANNMYVYRGGSAMNEKAASTTSWGILPATDFNYIQIFMEQVEEGELQKLMRKEADWGMKQLKRMAIEDFKVQRERTFLSGVRGVTNITVSNETQRFYTCGGILNDPAIPHMENQTLSTLDSGDVVTWLKTIFTGNNGSRKRYLLGGSDLIEALEKVKVENKWLLAKESEVVLGIEMVKLVSTFGSLDVMYYEQLDLLDKPKWGVVLDKPNMQIADLIPFTVSPIDYKSTGVKAVDAALLKQASTLLIKNKTTHHIIEGA